jgi:protein-tyrosine phosphatase
MTAKTILFVCTGNTCRSSMAEALAKDFLRRWQADHAEYKVECVQCAQDAAEATGPAINVLSAGTGAIENEPASPQARQVMADWGLDLSQHRARFLTTRMLQEADLILTMTQRHKDYIQEIMPDARGKVFLLKEYAQDENGLLALKEKADRLYRQIEKKKRAFFQEHRPEIEALGKRKEELLKQLKEIDNEYSVWEKQLAQIAGEELRELEKVEAELKNRDIYDPFGQPADSYQKCAEELREYIAKALTRFLQDNSSSKSK